MKKVKITHCQAVGKVFANLTDGSEHNTVPCPKDYKKKYADAIWVQGIGEPVRLLSGEYEIIE